MPLCGQKVYRIKYNKKLVMIGNNSVINAKSIDL